MSTISVIPQSVHFVFEDRPLFRIVWVGGDVTDVELNDHQLQMLGYQAVRIAAVHYNLTRPEGQR